MEYERPNLREKEEKGGHRGRQMADTQSWNRVATPLGLVCGLFYLAQSVFTTGNPKGHNHKLPGQV